MSAISSLNPWLLYSLGLVHINRFQLRFYCISLFSLLPFSLTNAASLRGLLCPLFLARFAHQLDCLSNQIGHLAAVTLVDQATPGLRPVSGVDSCPLESAKLFCVNPYVTPSLLRGTQLESYANCLPVTIEIIRLSVELERWSSLIAGASVNEFPGTLTDRI